MGNLFLSFTIAICGAIGLITLSRTLDLESYIYKILPVIPILYAIVYEILEHRRGGRSKSKVTPPALAKQTTNVADETTIIQGITAHRIITGVSMSFAIKFAVEIGLVMLFLRISGQTFTEAYGSFRLETVGTFLRGEHPWLSGGAGVSLLALIALITCLGTGLWIGYTTKGKAILEGVIAGTVITVFMSMTNMLMLYRKIEEVTIQLADSIGYVMRAGFLVVIALQVLLYGLWSGLVQMGKEERDQGVKSKKSKK